MPTFDRLPNRDEMPASISLESPANSLASLALTPAMHRLAEVVLAQWTKREVFNKLSRHGVYPIRNLLFYGPPGNGKTVACKWLAAKLNAPLYRVRCESLIDSWVGSSAKNVRAALDWLALPTQAIVLLDECETIFPARTNSDDAGARERVSAMAVLWQILDRWETPQLFVFATNMAERLDKALLSRFELQVDFGPPDREQTLSVLDYWAEVFHDFGPDEWMPRLRDREYSSFRELWLSIAASVREAALGGT